MGRGRSPRGCKSPLPNPGSEHRLAVCCRLRPRLAAAWRLRARVGRPGDTGPAVGGPPGDTGPAVGTPRGHRVGISGCRELRRRLHLSCPPASRSAQLWAPEPRPGDPAAATPWPPKSAQLVGWQPAAETCSPDPATPRAPRAHADAGPRGIAHAVVCTHLHTALGTHSCAGLVQHTRTHTRRCTHSRTRSPAGPGDPTPQPLMQPGSPAGSWVSSAGPPFPLPAGRQEPGALLGAADPGPIQVADAGHGPQGHPGPLQLGPSLSPTVEEPINTHRRHRVGAG